MLFTCKSTYSFISLQFIREQEQKSVVI